MYCQHHTCHLRAPFMKGVVDDTGKGHICAEHLCVFVFGSKHHWAPGILIGLESLSNWETEE